MMASCAMLGAEARLAKTDAMLLFTIVAVMSALARASIFLRAQPAKRNRA
jgi:4-amino-4-deoxy-L-arabinose transferase-like glycosyltransferase